MWIGRWASGDPSTELARLKASKDATWTDGPRVSGLASVVHEEAIGPPVVQRLPAAVTMHRRELRVVGFGSVYQIGFWGPQATLDDAVERAVLARISIEAPPPLRLARGGVSVTMPSGWTTGDCKDAACAFSPSVDGRPSDSWVYLVRWKAESLDAGAQRLLDALGRQQSRDVTREQIEIGGRPAVRVRFAMTPKDTGPAEFEELLLPAGGGFVLVAAGWRTPDGRAQLDSVLSTLRL
jgi:hypothetical protein